MATPSTGTAPVPPAQAPAPAPVVDLWPQAPASVPRARHALRRNLAAWGLEALADDAEVVLAELVTNAVEHARAAGGQIETRCGPLPRSAGVRLEVHDADAFRMPVLGRSAEGEVRGRGLQLVNALTHQMWGVTSRQGAPGKVVWAHVGGEADDTAPYCEASVQLGPRLVAQVLALDEGVAPELVARTLLCFLESGHADDHAALVYDHLEGADAGAVWSRWGGDARPRAVSVLADCPVSGSGGAGGCSLFAAHSGRHTWEWDI